MSLPIGAPPIPLNYSLHLYAGECQLKCRKQIFIFLPSSLLNSTQWSWETKKKTGTYHLASEHFSCQIHLRTKLVFLFLTSTYFYGWKLLLLRNNMRSQLDKYIVYYHSWFWTYIHKLLFLIIFICYTVNFFFLSYIFIT